MIKKMVKDSKYSKTIGLKYQSECLVPKIQLIEKPRKCQKRRKNKQKKYQMILVILMSLEFPKRVIIVILYSVLFLFIQSICFSFRVRCFSSNSARIYMGTVRYAHDHAPRTRLSLYI